MSVKKRLIYMEIYASKFKIGTHTYQRNTNVFKCMAMTGHLADVNPELARHWLKPCIHNTDLTITL